MNLLQKLKIKLDCSLRNSAGKKAIFFAQGVVAIILTALGAKSIGVRDVNTRFMILALDGLTRLGYLIKSGSGL